MLNVSVPTRLPFIKMPKLPESATFEAAFSFGLVWSAALRLMDVASTALKRMASFTAFTFLPRFCRFKQLFNFRRNLWHRLAHGLDPMPGQSVIGASGGKELVKPCLFRSQRTRFALT